MQFDLVMMIYDSIVNALSQFIYILNSSLTFFAESSHKFKKKSFKKTIYLAIRNHIQFSLYNNKRAYFGIFS